MFEDATDEIIRDAHLQSAVRTICKNVNVRARHIALQDLDGRDKPGRDGRPGPTPPIAHETAGAACTSHLSRVMLLATLGCNRAARMRSRV